MSWDMIQRILVPDEMWRCVEGKEDAAIEERVDMGRSILMLVRGGVLSSRKNRGVCSWEK